MKMNVSIAFVGLFLACSIVLQGCSLWGEDAKPKVDEDEEATAKCTGGGNFTCSGTKKWCAEQKNKCLGSLGGSMGSKTCTPQCTWECENKKCDQTCAPKCAPALCSTRCKKFNTQSCHMKCGSENCKVVCPKHFCPGKDCAACKTECGKPVCKMQCDKPEEQPCRHVCAQPKCKWECKKPTECPKPICHMKCEKPRNCMDSTEMVPQLPPLEPGETEVSAFHTEKAEKANRAPAPAPALAPAPAAQNLLQAASSTMRVDITTMGKDFKLHKSQVDVQYSSKDATAPATWTKMVRKHHGHVKESEASCENGSFQCNGDATWCAKQQTVVCQVAKHEEVADDSDASADEVASEALQEVVDQEKTAFLQQRSRMQGRLQGRFGKL